MQCRQKLRDIEIKGGEYSAAPTFVLERARGGTVDSETREMHPQLATLYSLVSIPCLASAERQRLFSPLKTGRTAAEAIRALTVGVASNICEHCIVFCATDHYKLVVQQVPPLCTRFT